MRPLAARSFSLAKIASKGYKQSDAALSCPSARLLWNGRACSGAPAPAPESTFAVKASASQQQLINSAYGKQGEGLPETAWRGFAADGGAVEASGCHVHAGAQRQPLLHPVPVILTSTYPSTSRHSASNAVTRPDLSADQPAASAAGLAGPRPPSENLATSPRSVSSFPSNSPALSTPTLPTAPARVSATVVTQAPVTATHTIATASQSSYNEPKDGSFSGHVVQHDGSHAVHLLVSGTSARDYNLRMVRCHARDELRFSSPTATHGPGSGAVCSTGLARSDDVSFATFLYRQVRDMVSATFLPAGYPGTTGHNYLRFITWQGVNNITMTANSVLASTFMLYAVGLGTGAIPTAGALNWVLKDGMGQLGTLLFGKTIAHNFDVHSKTWFFLSAVMLQAAAALELLTVLVPGHFLLMGSLANTLKGLAWMAAGSTRSVFHLSFARDNNIADVTAKGTSQYIFASLVGTAGGALICAAVGQSGSTAAACFGALAAATIGSAFLAVQAIPLSTLNATRLQLLVDAFLTSISPSAARHRRHAHGCRTEYDDDHDDNGAGGGGGGALEGDDRDILTGVEATYGGGIGAAAARAEGGFGGRLDRGGGWDRTSAGGGGMRRWPRPLAYRTVDRCYIGPSTLEYEMMYDDSLEPKVPTPLELTPLDPPVPYFSRTADNLSPPILVGSHLEHIVEGNANLLVMLLTTYKYAHFMVVPRRGLVHVVLHERADPRDIVQAYLQACILRRRLRGDKLQPLPDPDEQTAELRLELQESLAAAERLTTIFMSTIEANGWTVTKVVVEAHRRRARW